MTLASVSSSPTASCASTAFEYDAVLLDLRRLDISGDEVLRQMRKPFQLDELAAIVLAERAA